MQTIIVDILNDKVLGLLKDLEQLRLIKLRSTGTEKPVIADSILSLQGALKEQSLQELDGQLDELRNAWQ